MKVKAYVDGSYNSKNSTYGGGVVLFLPNLKEPLQYKCSGNNKAHIRLGNVAGELFAVLKLFQIIERINGVTDIEICYDYNGIEKWVTGEWRAKKTLTSTYRDIIRSFESKYNITFTKVAAHTGDIYNGLADKLAREAARE